MVLTNRRRFARRFYTGVHATDYRKYVFKLNKLIPSRHFLLKCRRYDLMPRFILDKKSKYFHPLLQFDHPYKEDVERLINTVQRKVLNMTIRINDWRIRDLEKIVSSHKQQLLNSGEREVSYNIVEQLLGEASFLKLSSKRNLIKKFQMLQDNQRKEHIQFDLESVINLTDLVIPEDVRKLCSFGPKLSLQYEKSDAPIIDFLASVENSIRTLNRNIDEKDKIRSEVTYATSRYLRKNNHIKYESNLLKELFNKTRKWFRDHREVIVIPSDKGNNSVILYKEDYIGKVNVLLSDNETYRRISRDPTDRLTKEMQEAIKMLHENQYITDAGYRKLYFSGAVAPSIYCLVKTHKVNHPVRPIVSTINSPHSSLAKAFTTILNNIVDDTINLKNSMELKKNIRDVKIPKGHILVSFDVKSLFTNVSVEAVLDIIDRKWSKLQKHTNMPLNKFRELLKLMLIDCNYFKYGDDIYQQTFGLPMGSNLAPVLANILLDDLVTSCLKKSTYKPKFLYKYVDDFILELHPEKISYLLNIFNSYHPRISFTYETEVDGAINYLDIKIIHKKEKNRLSFDWYKKEVSSNRLLNYISHHPICQKRNVATNFIYTVLKISDNEFHHQNMVRIRDILRTNNYPEKLVNMLIQKQHSIIMAQQNQRNTRKRDMDKNSDKIGKRFVAVKYIRSLSENIVKIFNNNAIDINVAHSTGNNLKQLYNKNKNKKEVCNAINTVYKIDCAGNDNESCSKTYIGTSSRKLGVRMKEHDRDQKQSVLPSNHTALCEHSILNKHHFRTENPKIVTVENNYQKRMLKESFHIYSHVNSVNYRQDTEGVNRIYKNVLKR